MACNENVIKNMASEATRNCQAKNVNVEMEFVVYLIEFLLLNPKYGKLFAKTLNRNNLEYFVNECVTMLSRGDTSINTLKMQFIIESNYDKPQVLIDRHLDSIETCLRPLVNEILDEDPGQEDVDALTKLYRKISIYIVLGSGLGNPGIILNLKEGMAALESVFTLEDIQLFVAFSRLEKLARLKELLEIVSGVRLFNRDCKLTGELIPDLPFNLVDAGKGCLASLSHSLIGVMQRVNLLTAAITDIVDIEKETGNVFIDVPPNTDLTVENCRHVFDLLSFNRQYEVFIRKLLADMETMVHSAKEHVEKFEEVLSDLQDAVKYKSAVPTAVVFPLFTKLWQVWRSMQNIMYIVSTVNLLMQTLASIQEHTKIPHAIVDKMVKGKPVVTDQTMVQPCRAAFMMRQRLFLAAARRAFILKLSRHRMRTGRPSGAGDAGKKNRITTSQINLSQRMSLLSMANYVAYSESSTSVESWERHVQFLGFCTICLSAGALVPANTKIGLIKHKSRRYGFCCVKMASRFSKDPQRYVNEVLDYARNNPHIINLLNIMEDVQEVRDVDTLVVTFTPAVKISDKDVQTEAHPLEEYKEKNYSWDLWEWKRRACQWATIVNCRTHSTQTHYSHMRSEIHCQTTESRDKCLQTKKDASINTNTCSFFLWGLRGQLGEGQHAVNLVQPHMREKRKAHPITACKWPCLGSPPAAASSSSSAYSDTDELNASQSGVGFYVPGSHSAKHTLDRAESRMISKKNAF